MNISFKRKIALVTGAGRGIGREIAKQLVNCGAEVYALAKNPDNLESLKKEVEGKLKTVAVDLANWNATKEAVESIGHIDLLVNNAGVLSLTDFVDITDEEIDRVYSVNVKAAINVSQVVAKIMKISGKGGSIVNVSSVASMKGSSKHALYSSSKCALDGLTKNMAVELGPYNIRVNSVNPQLTITDMTILMRQDQEFVEKRLKATPLRRFCKVEEIAHVVLFLLSDQASIVTGTIIAADGGLMAGDATFS